MVQSATHRYLLLDAMRGVAAMVVLWGHLLGGWGFEQIKPPQFFLAVDFFNMLSGFVIGHA